MQNGAIGLIGLIVPYTVEVMVRKQDHDRVLDLHTIADILVLICQVIRQIPRLVQPVLVQVISLGLLSVQYRV